MPDILQSASDGASQNGLNGHQIGQEQGSGTYDPAPVVAFFKMLDHGSVGGATEIRILPTAQYVVVDGRRHYVGKAIVGYYAPDAYEQAAQDIAPYDGQAQIYVTLNPCNPDLLARAQNRLQPAAKFAASDADIIYRQWLPIDFDPKRPSGISSTDLELGQALRQRDCVAAMLNGFGVPAIRAMSGNGGHLLIRLPDYLNDAEHTELVQNTLRDIAKLFNTAQVEVDLAVYNPARIWKVYGTLAVKGDNTQDRPHRRASLELPVLRPEPFDIRALNFGLPRTTGVSTDSVATRTESNGYSSNYPRLNVDDYLAQYGVDVYSKKIKDTHTIWEIPCPFNGDHSHGEAHIQQNNVTGKLGAACKHNSCAGKGWSEFKQAIGDAQPFFNSSIPLSLDAETALPDAELPELSAESGNHSFNSSSELSISSSALFSETPWPAPLEAAAFHGVAGQFVKSAEPHTEADEAALLVQFLVTIGIMMGRLLYFQVEATKHFLNLFVVMVGASAKARKGTSLNLVKSLLAQVDEPWIQEKVLSGLASGEGLIYQVRDPITKVVKGEEELVDEGVTDKRLLIAEEEFARTLKVMARDGNILSAVLRPAWDNGYLRTLTRNTPLQATGAHIGIIGHITLHELQKSLRETDAFNGFANRFLWICVRRSKLLPHGGAWRDVPLDALVNQLQAAMSFAQQHGRAGGELRRDAEADALWTDIYHHLSQEQPGLLGAVTSRAEAQVMRLACLYAVLDCSPTIHAAHLRAGLAVWRYAESSAAYIFGSSVGDPIADRILIALREHAPEGLTRTELSNLLGRNVSAQQIATALNLLEQYRMVRSERCDTGKLGRPAEQWFAVVPTPASPSLFINCPTDQQAGSYERNEENERNPVADEDQPHSSVSFVDSSAKQDEEEMF